MITVPKKFIKDNISTGIITCGHKNLDGVLMSRNVYDY